MDINNLPDPTIIVNQDDKIINLNEEARKLGLVVGAKFEISDEIEIDGEVYSVRLTDLGDRKIVVLRKAVESDFYRKLFELSPDGIVIHDGQKIIFANKRVSEITGIPHEKLIGMPVFKFIHPEYVNFVAERMEKMLREKKPVPPALEKFILPDGRVVSVEVSASYITYKDRPAILLVVRNVTDKVEMEKRYREFFENALDMIIVTDLQGNFVEVNREFEKVSGYRKEEVIGKNFREFFSEDEADYVFKMYNKAFRERKPLYGLEFKFKTKYGVERLLREMSGRWLRTGRSQAF